MRLLVSVSPGEWRIAAWDGRLADYAIHRPGAPDGLGDIHRGRVAAIVPAMAGSFVEIEGATGFLPDTESPTRPSVGQAILVRVTRAAQGGKGPRLSARLPPEDSPLAASGPPALLRRGPTALADLAARHPSAPIEIDDAATLATLGLPATLSRHAFTGEVEDEIAALAAPAAPLPGGATLHVHPTPALTALDIDLGAQTASRTAKTPSQLAANLALIPELARQIRLRNLCGAILVDFGGMPAKARPKLTQPLAAALAADPLTPRLLGFTQLGLAEILRPRLRPPLHERLAGPHAAGLAALRALAREISANPARPPMLWAAPEIASALLADPEARANIAARAGRPLVLRENPALSPAGWRLSEDPHG